MAGASAVVDGSLAERLAREGRPLNTRCGRRGLCRGCQVDVFAGEFELDGEHHRIVEGAAPMRVRACQVRELAAPLRLAIPEASRLEARGQIHAEFRAYTFEPKPRLRSLAIALERTSAPLIEQLARSIALAGLPALAPPPAPALSALARAAAASEHVDALVWVDVDSTHLIGLACGDEPLAVAVDIGTTTVCALLVDPRDGRELGRAARYNAQVAEGDDVATRIGAASREGGVARLQQLVVETINALVDEACARADVDAARVAVVAVAGNTVMSHLLLGLPVETIGRVPFAPVDLHPAPVRLATLGLRGVADGLCTVVPGISGYVGGDLVAGLHVSGLMARAGVQLLLDLGTNGEMILRVGERVWCCATAAGPAFEGGGIECGVGGVEGAVQHVALGADGRVDLDIIGGGRRAIGICGSAIVEFIAEVHRRGFVSSLGRLDTERLRGVDRLAVVEKGQQRVAAFRLATAEEIDAERDLVVTDRDIAEVLKAKGAIMAGIATLCEVAGVGVDAIDRFVLAGGFAHHLDIDAAVAMGLLPDLPRSRFEVIGNSSLAGAWLALIDEDALASCHALARLPEVVELNLVASFEDHFIEALMLPESTDEPTPPCASSC